MNKKILFISIFLAVIILVGIVFYFKDSVIFDFLFSEVKNNGRILARMEKMFPENIGDYSLYSWSDEKVEKESACDEDVCMRGIKGQYRQNTGNKVIFLSIVNIAKGKESLISTYKRSSTADKLGEYNIFRMENHEIWWIASGGVDLIVTQEGNLSSENGNIDYSQRATGDNPVTRYFISKYPPK